MPQQRLQVIPLNVFMQGVQNGKRRRRRNAAVVKDATGVSARQAKTQAKPQKVIQPFTALLYQSALAMQQEQAEAKRLQKAKPQQIIQPVTAFQFMAALANQLEQAETKQQKQPVAKQSIAKQQKQPAIKQQEQPAAQPVRTRKSAVRKPAVKPAPVITQAPPPQQPTVKPVRRRKPAASKPVTQPTPVVTQPTPVQRQPAAWQRLFRGSGLVVSFLYHLYGGAIGVTYALLFLLPQTFFVVVLFLFPALFPANPPRLPWEHIVSTALLLLAYTLTAHQHCAAVKHHNKWEQDDIGTLPVICFHGFYLLVWFLAAKVFL